MKIEISDELYKKCKILQNVGKFNSVQEVLEEGIKILDTCHIYQNKGYSQVILRNPNDKENDKFVVVPSLKRKSKMLFLKEFIKEKLRPKN